MIALFFAICLAIFAICFWRAFGELEPSQGTISSHSSGLDVDVDRAVAKRDGRAS